VSLRLRLLTAFALVALPPLVLLALTLASRTERLRESAARDQLDRSVAGVARRASNLAAELRRRLAAAAPTDLEADPDAALASLAESGGFDVVELLEDGQRRASHHWGAGVELPDDDEVFGDGSLRVESVAAGFGRERRLSVASERPLSGGGGTLLLRAGYLLDGDWLAEAVALSGTRLAWRDTLRGRWYPEPGPVAGWTPPPAGAGWGVAEAGDGPYLWRAAPVAPGLLLVGAVPRQPLLRLIGEQRRLLLLALAGAALAALAAALLLAGRLSRPVRDLADEVTRLGAVSGVRPLPAQPWDELDRLARAFDETAGELRASSGRLRQAERIAEWREMARRLAHELKNPLFPMQVSIETLRRALERQPPGDPELARLADETIAAVLTQIEALRRVVEDFSAFARMPRPRPEPVEIGALLERVATLQRPQAARVSIEVDAAGAPRTLLADAGLLERALNNLVSNALSALGGRGRVTLRARAEGEDVCLEVEDDGPGLDAEQRAQVFTPYYTTRRGGTGLGLPIVSAIAADHGGRVELESAAGRGARFTLRLPRRGPPGAAPVESARP
jgi:signal transduction histidine kinase